MSHPEHTQSDASSSADARRLRVEVIAAYVAGIALPVLETARRRTNFDELPFYVDDYIAGGLLLWAAIAVTRARPYGDALLVAAWGVVCGGLWGSFFGQLWSTDAVDVSGCSHAFVATIKGAMFAIAICSAVLSIRHAVQAEARR